MRRLLYILLIATSIGQIHAQAESENIEKKSTGYEAWFKSLSNDEKNALAKKFMEEKLNIQIKELGFDIASGIAFYLLSNFIRYQIMNRDYPLMPEDITSYLLCDLCRLTAVISWIASIFYYEHYNKKHVENEVKTQIENFEL